MNRLGQFHPKFRTVPNKPSSFFENGFLIQSPRLICSHPVFLARRAAEAGFPGVPLAPLVFKISLGHDVLVNRENQIQ
jgi:hypothetical protein